MEPDDIHNDLHYAYKEDLMSRFEHGEELGILPNSAIFAREPLFMGEDDTSTSMDGTRDSEDQEDIIILHIDIREPIKKLKTLLEAKIGMDFSKYEFWLQDAQTLEPHKNLVDQCVKGEGLVQINLQVRTESRRINIVDVLKPTDEALAELEHLANSDHETKLKPDDLLIKDNETDISSPSNPISSVDPVDLLELSTPGDSLDQMDLIDKMVEPDSEPIKNGKHSKMDKTKWIMDLNFKKDLTRLKISDDPKDWTIAQVRHWLQWAVRQFNLNYIKLQDWNMTGSDLMSLTVEEFRRKVPQDPDDIFWTHFELLRKCKMVAVRGQISDDEESDHILQPQRKSPKICGSRSLKILKSYHPSQLDVVTASQGNRTGHNGQIQLWQFLLEILTDREHVDIIQWIGGKGEFKLNNPERVAQLWGIRKNKLTMNYEKLSRALRYYYDGDMISKVHNKRFVYKFVCDLTQLIGYSAQELSSLVNQANPDTTTMYNGIL